MRRLSLLVLLLISTACADFAPNPRRIVDLFGTPTPAPSPTPLGDTLELKIVNNEFVVRLSPNSAVPGTRLEYLGQQQDLLLVRVNGLSGQKRPGDSFSWRGIIAPGVLADYNLSLLRLDQQQMLNAHGNVTLLIFNPEPAEASLPPQSPNLSYQQITIDYVVPPGRSIPGTTLVFEGESGGVVRFSGTGGLPTYALRDSLRWSGFVRNNVYIIYDLQLREVVPNGLHLIGRAQLFLYSATVE